MKHQPATALFGFAFLLLLLCSNSGFAASLDTQLASAGHPDTKLCPLEWSSKGLGKHLTIQFQKKLSKSEDQREALALLKLLQDAVTQAGQRFVGIAAIDTWEVCRKKDAASTYWFDYDGSWRSVGRKPEKYLKKLQKNLSADLRGTTAEAYVQHSLGMVEQRLGKVGPGMKRLEQAWAILERGENTSSLAAEVLAPLFFYHAGSHGDKTKRQEYLNAYALASQQPHSPVDYLPVVRVAPIYPRAAQQLGQEGYVVTEYTVTENGNVEDPIVLEEFPEGVFGRAALLAVQNFLYVPKVVDGQRVAAKNVRSRITFELAD